MNVDHENAMEFIDKNHRCMLATIKRDGRPQLSNVAQALIDGRVEISSTQDRAKVKNLQRDPRASALILSDDSWYQYVVVEGTATVTPMPEARLRLRAIYEKAAGKPHPNWQEFDDAMEQERRVVISISIDRIIT